MSDELRRELAFVATLLADVVAALASTYGEGSRLLHCARRAWRSLDQLRAEFDEDEGLERAGPS